VGYRSSIAWSAACSTIRQSVADRGRVRTCGLAAARHWHRVNTNTSTLVQVLVSRANIDESVALVLQCPTYEWIFTFIFWCDFAIKLCDRSFNWKTISFGKWTGCKEPCCKTKRYATLQVHIFTFFISGFIYLRIFIYYFLFIFACKAQPKYQAPLPSVKSICYSLWISSAHCHHNFHLLCLTSQCNLPLRRHRETRLAVSVTVTPQL